MANTKQGIYYPDNYNSVADVPEDMKKMAESIDAELENDRNRLETNETNMQALQTDNTTNKKDISDIKQEQTSQNANITKNASDIKNIQDKNTAQDKEIENINEKDTAQDTNIETLTQRLNEKDEQIAELKAENEDLKADLSNSQIHGQVSGEYVHLSDSAKMNCEIAILGNSKQETRQGYNKLPYPYSESTVTKKGVTFTVNEDGTIKVNGTPTEDAYFYLYQGKISDFKSIAELNGKKAKITQVPSSSTYYLSMYNFDNSGTSVYTQGGDSSYVTVDNQEQSVNIALCVKSGYVANNLVISPMILLEGETSTEYEQYGAMPSLEFESEIECVSSANVKVCNKNIEDNEFEIGSIDSTTGVLSNTNQCLRNKNFIRIKPNQKYVIKVVEYSGINSINTACRYFDRTYKYLGNKYVGGLESGKKEFTITDENVAFCKFTHLNSEVIPSDYTLKIQLEEDNETDYVEHKEQNYHVDMQEPFKGMPSNTNVDFYNYVDSEGNKYIRDCFVQKDGKFYEGHYIKRIVADGINYKAGFIFSSGWFVLRDINNKTIKNGLKIKDWAKLGIIKCNKFKTISMYKMQSKNMQGVTASSEGSINIKLDDATSETSTWTTDTVNAFLQENPLTIDYALAEPYYIECTEQQTQQLKALLKAKTYKNITNITTDTIAILDVNYKRDLETYQKQQDDRITAIEQLLSTTATSAMLLDNVQSDLESEVK